jgi:hypothetical protein
MTAKYFCGLIMMTHLCIDLVVSLPGRHANIYFSGTTKASFLIFGTKHQYGELYSVGQFKSAASPLPV